tara:strand:- start:6781 stop:6990 length:210 start_codon:yes stop_codon:yes gene_type:complete
MSELDEVLGRDSDGKLNWLVGKVTDITEDISIIKTNHLFHIERDLRRLWKVVGGIVVFLVSAYTGIQVM